MNSLLRKFWVSVFPPLNPYNTAGEGAFGCGSLLNCHWCDGVECSGARSGFKTSTCYFATNYDVSFGQLSDREACGDDDNAGTNSTCGMGCGWSSDYPDTFYRNRVLWPPVRGSGIRFLLRYSPQYVANNEPQQRRMANGKIRDLLSAVPMKAAPDTHWMRGTYYYNETGLECVAVDACIFSDPVNPPNCHLTDASGHCCHGESLGEPMREIYADAFWFAGSSSPNPEISQTFGCRHVVDRYKTFVVRPMAEILNNTNFFRSSRGALRHSTNALIGARARIVHNDSNCQSSFAYEPASPCQDKPFTERYNSGTSRFRFDFIHVLPNASLTFPQDYSDPTNSIKQRVLNYIQTADLPGSLEVQPMNFLQVDRDDNEQTYYSRFWNHLHQAPEDLLPEVFIPGLSGKLRYAGVNIPIKVVILNASLAVSIIAMQTSRQDGFAVRRCIEPHIRAVYTADLGIAAEMPTPVSLSRKWMHDGGRVRRDHSIVLYLDPDRDIYNDPIPIILGKDKNGVPVGVSDYLDFHMSTVEGDFVVQDFPMRVTWDGTLNSFSEPATPALVIPEGLGDPNITQHNNYFNAVADLMVNMYVPGTKHFDQTNAQELYTGGINLTFPP